MELCTDVSATVLILAISRFSSRRELPKLFVSDNFKSFKSIEVKNFLLKGGIKWLFILVVLVGWFLRTSSRHCQKLFEEGQGKHYVIMNN